MSPLRVKICGLTRFSDAELAIELGAWALGFVFAPGSPRRITALEAGRIVTRISCEKKAIGVFVDADLDQIQRTVGDAGLTGIQLHGSESVSFCERLRSCLPNLEIIKALRVGEDSFEDRIGPYANVATAVLLDTYVPGQAGGTGQTFDWNLLTRFDSQANLIVSGGLKASNVDELLKVYRPYAIDLSSGVEEAPGLKDPQKMKELFANIGGVHP